MSLACLFGIHDYDENYQIRNLNGLRDEKAGKNVSNVTSTHKQSIILVISPTPMKNLFHENDLSTYQVNFS